MLPERPKSVVFSVVVPILLALFEFAALPTPMAAAQSGDGEETNASEDAPGADDAGGDVPQEAVAEASGDAAREAAFSDAGYRSPFRLSYDPESKRSDFWIPLTNLLLPGFDQWWERQYAYGALYSGIWLGGNYYSSVIANRNDLEGQIERRRQASRDAGKDDSEFAVDARDITVRKYMLGQLLAQGAGGFSAWHSFRTAVRSRQPHGQYGFLDEEETPLEVLLAPFEFSHLSRPTTFIPLAIGLGIGALVLNSDTPENFERVSFTQADGFFASAFSWNAGTHEEAFFRGYLMPVMAEYWDNDFIANLVQSSVFALAHINSNPRPLPQLFLGFHLGSVSQRRGWTLSEAVFIHTWWDIIAFGVAYHYKQTGPEELASALKPVLWLPPLFFAF